MSRTIGRSFWPLLTGLALVTLLLAVSCGGASGEKGAIEESPQEEEPGGDQASVQGSEALPEGEALEHPFLGEEDAPVVLVEYADYQ